MTVDKKFLRKRIIEIEESRHNSVMKMVDALLDKG